MDNIIPESINDKISVLFTLVNNLYKTFADLTANFFIVDNTNNRVSVEGNTFTINTNNQQINLGTATSPNVMILHGTGEPSSITVTGIPNGSLFLTQNNNGEAYLRVSSSWKKLLHE